MNSQNITWWRGLVNFSCAWLFSVPHSLFRCRVTFSYCTLEMSSVSVSIHEGYCQKRVQWFCSSYQSCFNVFWQLYKLVLVNYRGNLAECWGVTCNQLVSILSRWSNNSPSFFMLYLMRTGAALELINSFTASIKTGSFNMEFDFSILNRFLSFIC